LIQSTAPDFVKIGRELLEQAIGSIHIETQVIVAGLALLMTVAIVAIWGKSIWRVLRRMVARLKRRLSAGVWHFRRVISSGAAAGIGGEKEEMIMVEPVGEPLSYSELNDELAQLTTTVGRIGVSVVPSDSSLLPENLSSSKSYVYLLRSDVPTEILRQQLSGFRRYKIKTVSVEWPVLFETDTWETQLRRLVGSLRQFGRDIASAETNRKRMGRLYVATENAAGTVFEWWLRDPQALIWDYTVDPATQQQHAAPLCITPTGESTSRHPHRQYPVRSLLRSAEVLGNVCFLTTITPPSESDHRMKGLVRPLLEFFGESDDKSDSESGEDTPTQDPGSQFGIDQRLVIWSHEGVDASEAETVLANAFKSNEDKHLSIEGRRKDGYQAEKLYKQLINADRPRDRPSTDSTIGRLRSNRSPVVLVDGKRLTVLSLTGPVDGSDLQPIDPGEPEE
jgi:hypothetical protein